MKAWIGCSGFHYKHWIDLFYPKDLPQRKWFDFYSQHFNTLELNVTFYRFPRLHNLENWYNISPKVFRFSVKAPKAITHFKQFKDTERMCGDFYGTTREGLRDKLGCVLFQLPSRAHYTEERLERILQNLDLSFSNVLEFRHASWWNEEVYSILSKNNISFCGMSHPEFPDNVVRNIPTIYYRFHGLHQLYQSPYSSGELSTFAEAILTSKKTKTSYIYFNNDIDGNALKNAKELMEIFSAKKNK